MWYDPNLQMVLLYGGATATGMAESAVWGFTGSTWEVVNQDTLSDIGGGGQIVYSSKLSKAIGWGGLPSFNLAASTETWSVKAQVAASGINPVQSSKCGQATPLAFNLAPTQ
jgi:hypothetical protein